MKKIIKCLALVLVIALAVSIVACGSTGRKRGDKNTLNFLYIWPEHEVAMNKIITDYMAEHPGVTINPSVVPHDEVDRALQSAYIGGTMPDVFFYWSDKVYKWVADDIPYALNDYADGWKEDFVSDGVGWEAGKVDGNYYAIPFRSTGFLILYNKSYFDVHPQWTIPTTLQEFEQLIMKIQADEPGLIPLGAYGGSGGTMYQFQTALSIFVAICNGSVEDPNYRTGRLAPDYEDDAGAKVIDKFKSYIDAGFFGPNPHAKTREDVMADFMNGQSAMCLFNNNELGTLLEGMEKGTEIETFAIPAPAGVDAKYIYGTYDSFCVANSAPNKELAVDFIKYLTSAEVQKEWTRTEKSIMVNKEVTYDDPVQQTLANEMQFVGKYDIYPDYNSGDKGDINFNLLLSYLNGSYKGNATDLLKEMDGNTVQAMRDSLLNPPDGLDWIQPTYTKKDYDDSWLNPVR